MASMTLKTTPPFAQVCDDDNLLEVLKSDLIAPSLMRDLLCIERKNECTQVILGRTSVSDFCEATEMNQLLPVTLSAVSLHEWRLLCA